MNKVSSIRRTPAFLPHEEAEMRAKDAANLAVSEMPESEALQYFADLPIKLFEHQYGRVRTDRVIQAKAMPPADWDLLPIGSLK